MCPTTISERHRYHIDILYQAQKHCTSALLLKYTGICFSFAIVFTFFCLTLPLSHLAVEKLSSILLQVECSQEANAEVMREMTKKLYSQYEEKLQEEEQKHKFEKETLMVCGKLYLCTYK